MDGVKQGVVKIQALCHTVAEPNRAGAVLSGSVAHLTELQTNTQTPLLKGENIQIVKGSITYSDSHGLQFKY